MDRQARIGCGRISRAVRLRLAAIGVQRAESGEAGRFNQGSVNRLSHLDRRRDCSLPRRASEGTKPRLALEIILGTGAARSDAVALTRSNIKGGQIRYRRKKTGIAAELPIMSELARELDHIPPGQMVLLTMESGTAYTPKGLSRLFPQWCERAGLMCCSTHGLRKARARILAEAGATELEIMSYLAHATPKEAATYTAAANRSAMTTSAVAKLLNKGQTNLSNRSEKLDKR